MAKSSAPDGLLRAVGIAVVSSARQAKLDKASLEEQVARVKAIQQEIGAELIDLIVLPGMSRRFYNFPEWAEAARQAGYDVGERMMRHWQAGDFDVLVYAEDSRIAREQSLFAEIVNRTIDAGARMFVDTYGWVDARNRRAYAADAGKDAAKQVDIMVLRGHAGKKKLVQQGLYFNTRPAWSHRVIRDPNNGRPVRIELDRDKLPIMEAAVHLALEGISWMNIEPELLARYGYVNTTAHPLHGDVRPFSRNFFYSLFYNPMFWGHAARGWRRTRKPNESISVNGQRQDLWVFDEACEVPAGVLIQRNAFAPALTGPLAEALKAELLRRRMSIRGSARPYRMCRFSGLLVCAHCAAPMGFNANHTGHNYYRCPGRFTKHPRPVQCQRPTRIPERSVQAFVAQLLEQALTPEAFASAFAQPAPPRDALAEAQAQIARLEKRAAVLVRAQEAADENLFEVYSVRLKELSGELKALREEAGRLSMKAARVSPEQQLRSLAEIKAYSLEAFWALPDTEINRLLHGLFGLYRMVVDAGTKSVIGIVLPPPR